MCGFPQPHTWALVRVGKRGAESSEKAGQMRRFRRRGPLSTEGPAIWPGLIQCQSRMLKGHFGYAKLPPAPKRTSARSSPRSSHASMLAWRTTCPPFSDSGLGAHSSGLAVQRTAMFVVHMFETNQRDTNRCQPFSYFPSS